MADSEPSDEKPYGYHYATGAAHRVGTDRDDLVEDLVSNGFDREQAEKGVDAFLEELNDE